MHPRPLASPRGMAPSRTFGLLFLGLILVLGACSSDSDSDDGADVSASLGDESTSSTTVVFDGPVEIAGTIAEFRLPTMTVDAGREIGLDNLDDASHTFTSSDGLFDTGTIDRGQNGTFVAPADPGTYAVYCRIHPTMQAELTVT